MLCEKYNKEYEFTVDEREDFSEFIESGLRENVTLGCCCGNVQTCQDRKVSYMVAPASYSEPPHVYAGNEKQCDVTGDYGMLGFE